MLVQVSVADREIVILEDPFISRAVEVGWVWLGASPWFRSVFVFLSFVLSSFCFLCFDFGCFALLCVAPAEIPGVGWSWGFFCFCFFSFIIHRPAWASVSHFLFFVFLLAFTFFSLSLLLLVDGLLPAAAHGGALLSYDCWRDIP